jgi:Prion-inhibition and propagation/Protein kinase domain
MFDIVGVPARYHHFLVRLRLEQTRLLNWGEKVGLMEDLLDQPSRILQLHRNLTLEILLEMQNAFKACLKTKGQYDPLLSTAGSPLKTEKDRRTMLQKTTAFLDKMPQLAARLQWAIIDQEKFSTLVNQLIGYNDSIESLLDRNSLDQVQVMQRQSHMAILQMTSKIDELMDLAKAFNLHALRSEFPGVPRSSAAAHEEVDAETSARLAVFKAEQTGLGTKRIHEAALRIDRHRLDIESRDERRPRAIYQNAAVWIEWKEYNGQLGLSADWNRILLERVQKLAMLLSSSSTPPEFHVPHCLGYLDGSTAETDRFGLVYSIPARAATSTGPTSLRQCLQIGMGVSLNTRMALAHAIAQSLMYLHAVSWLHKSVRSDNVLFFSEPSAVSADLSRPILSGFGYARPDNADAETEQFARQLDQDLYRPPECQSTSTSRSKKSYDIYALGVVLMEIAYWKPIEEILQIDLGKKGARKDVRGIQARLISEDERFLQKVEEYVGESYARVVYRCLAGGVEIGISNALSNEDDPIVGAEMVRVFSEEIVGRLGSIKL